MQRRCRAKTSRTGRAGWLAGWLGQKRGLTERDVNNTHLIAIKAIYRIGMGEKTVSINPAVRVAVAKAKTQSIRSKGRADAEARAILSSPWCDPASLRTPAAAPKLAIRRGPSVCADTENGAAMLRQINARDCSGAGGAKHCRLQAFCPSERAGGGAALQDRPWGGGGDAGAFSAARISAQGRAMTAEA